MSMQAQERYATQQERLRGLVGRMHHNLATSTDLDGLDKLIEAMTRCLFHGDKIAVQSAQAAARAERQRHSDFDRAQQEKAREVVQEQASVRERAAAEPNRFQAVDLRGDGHLTLAELGPPGGHTAGDAVAEAVADSADKHLIANPPLEPGHGSTPGIVMSQDVEQAQDERREQQQAQRSEALEVAGRGESDMRPPPGEGQGADADEGEERNEGAVTSAGLIEERQAEQHDTERGAQGEEPHEGVETSGPGTEGLVVKQKPPVAKPGRKRGFRMPDDK